MTAHDIDLHSEYLRADLFVAMGQPIEAAKVLEAVLAAEPGHEAAWSCWPAATSARPS